MPRKITGKITQKDKNAYKSLELAENINFWNREFIARKFFSDYQQSPEVFKSIKADFHTLLISIYFELHQISNSWEDFLKSKLPKTLDPSMADPFDEISDEISMDYEVNFEIYTSKISSIMDTILNSTEASPAGRLNGYVKCKPFYIENIKETLIRLKHICLNYGLYPHQLFKYVAAEYRIETYEKQSFNSHETFFLHIPTPIPPVVFNHAIVEKKFYEKEQPHKFYYYWNMSREQDYEAISEKIIILAEKLRKGEGTNRDEENNRKEQLGTLVHQIAIDVSHEDYTPEKCKLHIKSEMQQCFFYFRENIQSLSHVSNIDKSDNIFLLKNELNIACSEQRDIEYEQVRIYNICQGGYNRKHNNLSLLCGLCIWDLEFCEKIPSKFTERLLASDTKEKLTQEILKEHNVDEEIFNEIQRLKEKFTSLGHNLKRTAINQNYRSVCKIIETSLRHPLYK